MEKSKQSGVQIISNLADVSNLIASSTSPRNSGLFPSTTPLESANADADTSPAFRGKEGGGVQAVGRQGEADVDEGDEKEKNVMRKVGPKGDLYRAVIMKQRSLERGGSLKPPPRQNSVKVGVGFE